MTLLAMLLVGAAGSAFAAWGLARGGTAARIAGTAGVVALVVVAVLAAASPTPDTLAADATGAVPGTLWNGALIPNGYLRLVIVLWAASSVVLAGIAWMLRGAAGLRALLPATLAALTGGAVSLAASSPILGLVAAGATGLASVPAVLAASHGSAPGIAAREIRIAITTALVVVAVAAVGPVISRLVLANPDGPASAAGSGAAAAVAFGLLAMAVVVAARVGIVPYHVRISALSDVAVPASLPLMTAWLPLPLAAASVGVAAGVLAPMALPVGAAQAVILAVLLLAALATALVAFLQDDLRHAVGYLTIADLGLVVLALASLDPAAWGPARSWLLMVAVTKTALAAWAAVAEDRFETRSVPDLRGWVRPSPLLGLGLLLIVVATYGYGGWAVLRARLDLVDLAAGGPWNAILLLASFLTLPTYLRWLWLGVGLPTSHVDRAAPEFASRRLRTMTTKQLLPTPTRRNRNVGLPVEQETSDAGALLPATAAAASGGGSAVVGGSVARASTGRPPSAAARLRATASGGSAAAEPASTTPTAAKQPAGEKLPGGAMTGAAAAPAASGDPKPVEAADAPTSPSAPRRPASGADATTRAATAVRRHRTGLLTGAVVALALLASAVAYGALDVSAAAAAPGPAAIGVSTVGG
jgi:hypothetical protein